MEEVIKKLMAHHTQRKKAYDVILERKLELRGRRQNKQEIPATMDGVEIIESLSSQDPAPGVPFKTFRPQIEPLRKIDGPLSSEEQMVFLESCKKTQRYHNFLAT
jgi:hypothetical protein